MLLSDVDCRHFEFECFRWVCGVLEGDQSGMKVYEALHNPMVYESTPYTISIHLSKEGAEKAISDSKVKIKKEFDELWDGEKPCGKWDDHQYWSITETEVLP